MAEDWVKFKGACCPPAQPDEHDGYFVTGKDMRTNLSRFPGLPVLKEHDANLKVGEITKAHIDDSQRLIVEGKINRCTREGAKLVHKIRDGKIGGLSVGTTNLALAEDPNTIIGKRFTEVSFVKEPDHNQTEVQHIEEDSTEFVRRGRLLCQIVDLKLKHDLYLVQLANKELDNRREQQRDLMQAPIQPGAPTAPPPQVPMPPAVSTPAGIPQQQQQQQQQQLPPVQLQQQQQLPLPGQPQPGQQAIPDQQMMETKDMTPEQYQDMLANMELLKQQNAQLEYRLQNRDEIEKEEHKIELERQALAEKHSQNYKITRDHMAAMYAKTGDVMPESAEKMFGLMESNPALVSPVVDMVAVAHKASAMSQTKSEKHRVKDKKKIAQLKDELRMKRDANQADMQQASYQQQANYAKPSNLPMQPPGGFKKPRTEDMSPASSSSSTPASNPNYAPAQPNLPASYRQHAMSPIRRGAGIQNSSDPLHEALAQQMWDARGVNTSGKLTMSFPRIAGQDVGSVRPVGNEQWTSVEAERLRLQQEQQRMQQ